MNRILKYSCLAAMIFLVAGLASCVKSRNDLNTDFGGLKPLVELRTPPANVAGLLNFAKASLNFTGDPDTVLFYINLASVDAMNKDLKVSIEIDNDAMATYNASQDIQYALFPDSTFSFTETEGTIAAGQHVVPIHVVFYPSKIDPTQTYMLPLTIKDAEGINISANFGTIYYHLIGNPLAGNYKQDFHRWNNTTDTTTAPNSTNFTGQDIVISPINPTTLLLPESYIQTFVGSTAGVALQFDDDHAGNLTNFQVYLDAGTLSGLAGGGFTVITAPVLVGYTLQGDASNHYAGTTFRIYTVLNNSSGATRTLIDQFTKQ